MENVRFVGLDVHAESIAIAVAEPGRGEPRVLATIPNDTAMLRKRLRRLGRVKCCYEAGPTGFGLYRDLTAAGIDTVVVAPSLVPTKAGDRVKTDRRDAVKLARFLRSGDLTEIHVPDAATAAMRDLERAREDAKNAERADAPPARQVPSAPWPAVGRQDHLDEQAPRLDPRPAIPARGAAARARGLPQDGGGSRRARGPS